MTDEEVAVKLEGHDHEIKSLKHRMGDQEEQSKTIQELVLTVKELAINMQAMLKEQITQGEEIAKLKSAPGDTWGNVKRAIINTIVGVVAGAFATGAIVMVAQNLKVGG